MGNWAILLSLISHAIPSSGHTTLNFYSFGAIIVLIQASQNVWPHIVKSLGVFYSLNSIVHKGQDSWLSIYFYNSDNTENFDFKIFK